MDPDLVFANDSDMSSDGSGSYSCSDPSHCEYLSKECDGIHSYSPKNPHRGGNYWSSGYWGCDDSSDSFVPVPDVEEKVEDGGSMVKVVEDASFESSEDDDLGYVKDSYDDSNDDDDAPSDGDAPGNGDAPDDDVDNHGDAPGGDGDANGDR